MNEHPSFSYTRTFVRSLAGLPQNIQKQFEGTLITFRHDPADPRLHTKKLSGKFAGMYSLRIGRDYRILFRLASRRTVEFLDIGHRKDIYR